MNPGGIDQVRTVNQTVQFDLVHPRSRVIVPNADGGKIEDLTLSLCGGNNPYLSVEARPFYSPDSVHIAIIGQDRANSYYHDITQPLVIELQRLLDSQDREATMKSYAKGMSAWLQFADAYLAKEGFQYSRAIFERDQKLANKLVETTKPSMLLTQLGDRSCGLGGSLHIFNYLYDYIALPGVSLKKFMDVEKIDFSGFSTIGVECEQPVPEGGIKELTGAVNITLQTTIHNPLRDQLADLQTTITKSLTDIDQKLQISGDIMQSLANAHDQLLVLRQTIDTFEDHLASSLAELNQLKTTILNLGQKIDSAGLNSPQ